MLGPSLRMRKKLEYPPPPPPWVAPQLPENNSHSPQIPKTPKAPCADPGFSSGGPGQSDKKSSDNVFWVFFFLFFWSSAYFTEVKWLIKNKNKKTIIFQGSRGGPTFSRWGGNFSRGVQLLIPYRNAYNF